MGLRVRREILGDAHVDRAEESKSELDAEFQDLITRYAWGEIWMRPGLPRHTRSLLTIGLMVALNRGEEVKLHILAAKNSGRRRRSWRCFCIVPCIAGYRRRTRHFVRHARC